MLVRLPLLALTTFALLGVGAPTVVAAPHPPSTTTVSVVGGHGPVVHRPCVTCWKY